MGNETSHSRTDGAELNTDTDKSDDNLRTSYSDHDVGESTTLETSCHLHESSSGGLQQMDQEDDLISSEVMRAIIENLTPEGNEEVLDSCVDESLMSIELETDSGLFPILTNRKKDKACEGEELAEVEGNPEIRCGSTVWTDSLQEYKESELTEKLMDAEDNSDTWWKPSASDTFSNSILADGVHQPVNTQASMLPPYYKETLEPGSPTDSEHLQLNNHGSYNDVLKSRFPAVSNAVLASLQSLDIPLHSLIPPSSFQLDTVIATDSLRTRSNENPEHKDIKDENHGSLSYILQFKGGASLYEVKDKTLSSYQNDPEWTPEKKVARFFKRMKMMPLADSGIMPEFSHSNISNDKQSDIFV